ncbi:hypothetical protein [cf. Phormidesmis sp. LEGE 11477]|uniref:hypothetical protein n=1 Tax=cf. Phormidesmis sp. LEGE 11477 TaxID=1828680 RepID=UPI001882832C|nr:hypothetical protein [cf. Phormidesmis sp. LEGE 11477]MBE9060498.1 hypothetical protein [cf. Phormidesmis sp. LEGE 11477]
MQYLLSEIGRGVRDNLLDAFCAIAQNLGPVEQAQLSTNWCVSQLDGTAHANYHDHGPPHHC